MSPIHYLNMYLKHETCFKYRQQSNTYYTYLSQSYITKQYLGLSGGTLGSTQVLKPTAYLLT